MGFRKPTFRARRLPMTRRSWLPHWFDRTHRGVRKASTGGRPVLEALEDRLAPAVFLVNTTADSVAVSPATHTGLDSSGHISLRSAIMAANATPGADTVMLPGVPAGMAYELDLPGSDLGGGSAGDLDVTHDLKIQGAGPNTTAIEASNLSDRIFDVVGATVAISGVTMFGGHSDRGGGILNEGGNLTITDCVITGNVAVGAPGSDGGLDTAGGAGGAGVGGGIDNAGGILTLIRTTVSSNRAIGGPGGSGGNASSGGTQGGAGGAGGAGIGGGIYSASGALNLFQSTIADNSALGGAGGAGPSRSVTGSTAGGSGTFKLTIAVSGPGGAGGAGGAGLGGGISIAGGAVINQSTIAGNLASGGGGGGGGAGPTASLTFAISDSGFTNSIITQVFDVAAIATGDGGAGGAGGAGSGGGLNIGSGLILINQSSVSGNQASGAAGGAGGTGPSANYSSSFTIANYSNCTFTITHSQTATATGNGGVGGTGGAGSGGGVYSGGGITLMNQGSISGNQASGAAGGAGGGAPSADCPSTVFVGGSPDPNDHTVINFTGPQTITATGTAGTGGTGGAGIGGGVYRAAGGLVLRKTDVSGNLATTSNPDEFGL
jgi:hypothetical protein